MLCLDKKHLKSSGNVHRTTIWHGALIAYGIKLSVDVGFNGDVTLDAKTPELTKHYERDFGALLIPGRKRDSAPRYLICDEAARDIFVSYLEEG